MIGEELKCVREPANMVDRYTVAVTKDETIVGHFPRKISRIASLFICQGGKIMCQVKASIFRSNLRRAGSTIPVEF